MTAWLRLRGVTRDNRESSAPRDVTSPGADAGVEQPVVILRGEEEGGDVEMAQLATRHQAGDSQIILIFSLHTQKIIF